MNLTTSRIGSKTFVSILWHNIFFNPPELQKSPELFITVSNIWSLKPESNFIKNMDRRSKYNFYISISGPTTPAELPLIMAFARKQICNSNCLKFRIN